MGFKKIRGISLPEEKQGLIRYTCLTYREQPAHIQRKIRRLCQEQGGQYSAALWEVMCTTESATSISMRNHIGESTLYRIRKKFYENWDKSGKKT